MEIKEKTIDEKKFVITPKVAISIMGFLLVVSNLFTRQITVITENSDDIVENQKANRRRLQHSEEKSEYKLEIADLKIKLELCRNGVQIK